MGKITNEYTYTALPIVGSEIIDKETGEIFDVSNSVLLKRTEIGKISIGYTSFIYLNTEKLRALLVAGIKQVDLALLISMSSNLLIGKNISFKDADTPHTAASIGKLIGLSEQSTKLKLNRMVDEGLLHYGTLEQEKHFGKVYVVNPNLIKKGLSFSNSLIELFHKPIAVKEDIASYYHYKEYFHIDTSRLLTLFKNEIKQVDLALLISMSCSLEEEVNISLKNADTPHTAASIGELIGLSKQSTKLKLNDLVNKDLLHYGVLKEKKGFGKVYIVNPHLIKTTKSFNSFLAGLFNDIK